MFSRTVYRIALLSCVTLLCQCASKHQPAVFPAHFPLDPDSLLSDAANRELKLLEEKPTRNSKETKRLFDLYTAELRQLRPASERHQTVTKAMEGLRGQLGEENEALLALQMEALKSDAERRKEETRKPVESAQLKKRLSEAYRLWNANENEGALQKIEAVIADPGVTAGLGANDLYRLHQLWFRVLLDVRKLSRAGEAFARLVQLEPCSKDTAQSGFVLAVAWLGEGKAPEAWQQFQNLCDPDKSYGAELRRRYWRERFREAATGEKGYATAFAGEFPGYYSYLAAIRGGHAVQLPPPATQWTALTQAELTVSSRTARYLREAEERLRFSLRRDSSLYLRRIADTLVPRESDDDRLTLLYTAQLFQAAGNHLEAMRLYAYLVRQLVPGDAVSPLLRSEQLFQLMFPRPFSDSVEGLASQWQVDADFIYSLMRQESAFNPGAISSANARGLMQLMPALAKSIADKFGYQSGFSEKSLFRGEENLRLATYHLRQLWIRAPHIVLVAAGYNAGMARVAGWWRRFGHLPLDIFVELIPVPETRDYVKYVMRNYVGYRLLKERKPITDPIVPLSLPPAPPLPVLF